MTKQLLKKALNKNCPFINCFLFTGQIVHNIIPSINFLYIDPEN